MSSLHIDSQPDLETNEPSTAVEETIFHDARWEDVFSSYRLPYDRLIVERDGQTVGVLPLVWQKSHLFGNQLVSLPWFDAAGLATTDSDAGDQLISTAMELAATRGATLQLRQLAPLDVSVPVRHDKVLMELALPSESEELWSSFPAKVRNQVRKAEKSGLEVVTGGVERLDDFYHVYSTNMRDLGSPAHSRRFFQVVLSTFPTMSHIHTVHFEGQVVGGGLTLNNGSAMEIPWASSLREFNRMCVNHGLYWHILEQACTRGFSKFRFGRSSRDSGTYKFKKQWGAKEVQLHWYLFGDEAAAAAPPTESYGWATRVWQKLPVSLTRTIGPLFISKIP